MKQYSSKCLVTCSRYFKSRALPSSSGVQENAAKLQKGFFFFFFVDYKTTVSAAYITHNAS